MFLCFDLLFVFLLGVGYAQVISTGIVATYYVTIMAITLHYFFNSFKSILPWTECQPEWGNTCTPSSRDTTFKYINQTLGNRSSSAELYYEYVFFFGLVWFGLVFGSFGSFASFLYLRRSHADAKIRLLQRNCFKTFNKICPLKQVIKSSVKEVAAIQNLPIKRFYFNNGWKSIDLDLKIRS